ncbi:hypothetical protein V490_03889 [Pseudogymnoascus sp. VKM F-3557]|nr:hypothetical protein V490_03889 [Pseudogymnoascus sp. VKM F-3557]
MLMRRYRIYHNNLKTLIKELSGACVVIVVTGVLVAWLYDLPSIFRKVLPTRPTQHDSYSENRQSQNNGANLRS